MDWKRRVHAERGTILIETYSFERQDGRLLTALAEKVAPHVTVRPRPAEAIYDRIIELNHVDTFSKLFGDVPAQVQERRLQPRRLREDVRADEARRAGDCVPEGLSRRSSRNTRNGSAVASTSRT